MITTAKENAFLPKLPLFFYKESGMEPCSACTLSSTHASYQDSSS